MKLYPDKLEAHLQRGAAAVYLVHGDEPLQAMEVADRLRAKALEDGFSEREVVVANEEADWAHFEESADSLSLFAERRVLDLRLPAGKPGRQGAEVLKRYCAAPPADLRLLISSGKLERGALTSAWFKAIDKVGVAIQVRPPHAEHLPEWLGRRLAAHALQATPDALALLAERVEGNLLAAAQEVERLALLYPAGVLEVEQVIAAVADSARYALPDLPIAALDGQLERSVRIVRGLAEESVSEVLVLWALSQEIRSGARAAEAHAEGVAIDRALKAAGVWQSRMGPLKNAMARHTAPVWLEMLAECSRIDRLIKGQESGEVWIALEALCVRLASAGTTLVSSGEARWA